MFPGKGRPAVGRMALAMLTIVVIVVGGAVGLSYPKSGQGATVTVTASVTSSASGQPTISSSLTSSAVTSTSHTASAPIANFVLNTLPNTILLAPGANFTYPTVSVIPLPSSREVLGNLDVGSELVVLNATVPNGLSFRFAGSNLVNRIYKELSITDAFAVNMNLAAAKDVAPGDYQVSIFASSGTFTAHTTFTVRVVPYLVIVYANTFGPASLTVKAGTTVYWLNLGGVGGPENYCDILFDNKLQSPTLNGNIFDSWSYTFTTPGTYPYHSAQFGPLMSGTVVVTS